MSQESSRETAGRLLPVIGFPVIIAFMLGVMPGAGELTVHGTVGEVALDFASRGVGGLLILIVYIRWIRAGRGIAAPVLLQLLACAVVTGVALLVDEPQGPSGLLRAATHLATISAAQCVALAAWLTWEDGRGLARRVRTSK